MIRVHSNRLYLSLLLLWVSLVALAQPEFTVIANRQGLPENSIHRIAQDERGFIWMATFNGICRYEGTRFTTFRHDAANPYSLRDNTASNILPLHDGLLVATGAGLDFYRFSTGHFDHCTVTGSKGDRDLSSSIFSLLRHGNRIFATDIDGAIYVSQDSPTRFRRLVVAHRITTLQHFRDGLLLGVGPDGIYLLTSDARRVVSHYPLRMNVRYNFNVYYSRVAQTIYVGYGIGHPSAAFRVVGQKIVASEEAVPSDLMYTLDYKDRVVFACDGKGLVMRDRDGRDEQYLPTNSNIPGDAIYTLFEDRDHNLWVGTYRAGVCVLFDEHKVFARWSIADKNLPYNIVTAVCPTENYLYLGFDGGGLGIFNRHTGRMEHHLTTANSELPGNNVLSVFRDGQQLWMGIYTQGLVCYDLVAHRLTTYAMPHTTGADDNNVWTLLDDGDRILVGSNNFFVFNKQTRTARAVRELVGAVVSSMSRSGGQVVVATRYTGIYVLDGRTLSVVRHLKTLGQGKDAPPCVNVRYIYVDRKGRWWVNVEFRGFYCYDPATGRSRHFDVKQGLTNVDVTSMAEDERGNLWMATSNGLFCYNPQWDTFVRYDEDKELPSVFTCNSAASYRGQFYFGSTQGMLSFSPSAIKHPQQQKGGVSLMTLRLLNDGRELPLYGQQRQEVTLDHDQNFFTITFALPNYASPHRTHFRCYLKGLEQQWREVGGSREMQYTNVPPGTYEFMVAATDLSGRWGKPTVLTLTVLAPWYLTWWARMLWWTLAILVLVLAFLYYRHRVDARHRERMAQLRQRTQQRLQEAKMDFYTNVTHELRTPTFMISAQVEELLSRGSDPVVKVPASYMESLRRSAEKLNRIVNSIIDFRKQDAYQMRLNVQRKDVVAFCENLATDYYYLCAQKQIAFDFYAKRSELFMRFDPDKLETIITNLVSNAFKYTKSGGRVRLSVVPLGDDSVEFSVEDNGMGIVEEMQEQIFQRFTRTKRGQRASHGDGIGLASVKELVELHGGEIRVESVVGRGSRFVFSLPTREEALPESAGISGNPVVAGTDKPDAPAVFFSSGQEASSEPQSQPVLPIQFSNPTALHTILIVDDEPGLVELLDRGLSADYRILKAYDGEEGLRMAREQLPDLVVADWQMPRMDGAALLQAIKDDGRLRFMQVLVLTAATAEEEKLRAFELGAADYLLKPVSVKYLRERVKQILQRADDNATQPLAVASERAYTKEEQAFIGQLKELIDQNLSNDEFDMKQLANLMAMSHSALYKKVKAITGLSLVDFVNDYKLSLAIIRFRQGESNVTHVCQACGFKDVKNFRTLFKRKMGVTPKQFVLSL